MSKAQGLIERKGERMLFASTPGYTQNSLPLLSVANFPGFLFRLLRILR